jgi:outer membrane protein assembly factor BamB
MFEDQPLLGRRSLMRSPRVKGIYDIVISVFSSLAQLVSIAAIYIFALLLSPTLGAETCDWYRWGGPGGDFTTEYKNWNPNGIRQSEIVWNKNVGSGYSSVSIKDGRLYTMGYQMGQDTVYCLNAENGKLIWSYSYPSVTGSYPGPRATPILDDQYLYTLSRIGMLHCFDASEGKIVWKVDLVRRYRVDIPTWGISGTPVVEDDLLVLNVLSSGMALDKRSGELVWMSKRGYCGYASPVTFDHKGRRCAFIFSSAALYLVDVRTGKRLWNYDWINYYDINASDPLLFDNKLFITSYDKCALLDISGNKPKTLWSNRSITSHFSACFYRDGYIYGSSEDIFFYGGDIGCIDAESGRIKWKAANIGVNWLIMVNRDMLIVNGMGDLFTARVDPDRFEVISEKRRIGLQNFWSAPVFCGGRLFIRNDGGDLLCLKICEPE